MTPSQTLDSKIAIRIKRLPHSTGLPMPSRASTGSSGFDVCAAIESDMILQPGDRKLVPTGFCAAIANGYEIQVRSRSGLAAKHGVAVLNSPGTIDADYRGEIKVILINHGRDPFTIRHGDRIAQLVPMKIPSEMFFSEVEDLDETTRGSGGFGSSGISRT